MQIGKMYFELSWDYLAGAFVAGAVQALYVLPLALLARRLILKPWDSRQLKKVDHGRKDACTDMAWTR